MQRTQTEQQGRPEGAMKDSLCNDSTFQVCLLPSGDEIAFAFPINPRYFRSMDYTDLEYFAHYLITHRPNYYAHYLSRGEVQKFDHVILALLQIYEVLAERCDEVVGITRQMVDAFAKVRRDTRASTCVSAKKISSAETWSDSSPDYETIDPPKGNNSAPLRDDPSLPQRAMPKEGSGEDAPQQFHLVSMPEGKQLVFEMMPVSQEGCGKGQALSQNVLCDNNVPRPTSPSIPRIRGLDVSPEVNIAPGLDGRPPVSSNPRVHRDDCQTSQNLDNGTDLPIPPRQIARLPLLQYPKLLFNVQCRLIELGYDDWLPDAICESIDQALQQESPETWDDPSFTKNEKIIDTVQWIRHWHKNVMGKGPFPEVVCYALLDELFYGPEDVLPNLSY